MGIAIIQQRRFDTCPPRLPLPFYPFIKMSRGHDRITTATVTTGHTTMPGRLNYKFHSAHTGWGVWSLKEIKGIPPVLFLLGMLRKFNIRNYLRLLCSVDGLALGRGSQSVSPMPTCSNWIIEAIAKTPTWHANNKRRTEREGLSFARKNQQRVHLKLLEVSTRSS